MIGDKVLSTIKVAVAVALAAVYVVALFAQGSLAAAVAATLFALYAALIVATSRRRVHDMFVIGACLSILAGISQLFSAGVAPLAAYLSVEGVVALLCGAIFAASKRERRTFRRTE